MKMWAAATRLSCLPDDFQNNLDFQLPRAFREIKRTQHLRLAW
jgi:hypothetical protein